MLLQHFAPTIPLRAYARDLEAMHSVTTAIYVREAGLPRDMLFCSVLDNECTTAGEL